MHRKGVETPENALIGVVSGCGGAPGARSRVWPVRGMGRPDPEDWPSTARVRGHPFPENGTTSGGDGAIFHHEPSWMRTTRAVQLATVESWVMRMMSGRRRGARGRG